MVTIQIFFFSPRRLIKFFNVLSTLSANETTNSIFLLLLTSADVIIALNFSLENAEAIWFNLLLIVVISSLLLPVVKAFYVSFCY